MLQSYIYLSAFCVMIILDEDDNVYSGSIQPKSSELHEFIRTQKQKVSLPYVN